MRERARRISRRVALLGLAGGAGALALGGGAWLWATRARRPELLTYTGHHGAPVTALTWSPNGAYIVSGDANGVARILDPATGATVLNCQVPAAKSVVSLSWAPDGASILTGYANMLVIWDAKSGKPMYSTAHLTEPAAYSPSVTYKPCYLIYQALLAASQDERSALVFPASSLDAPIASLDSGSMSALAFDPRDESLALALVTSAPPRELAVYRATIPSACDQSGDANATLSYDRIGPSDPHYSDLDGLSTPWRPGGGYLLAENLPGKVVIKGAWGAYEMDHPAEVVAAALCPARRDLPWDAHPDGWYTVIGYIATADSVGTVRVWGNDGKYVVAMRASQPVRRLAWSPDGYFLAVVRADGAAQVWRADLTGLPAIWRNTSFN